MMNLKERIDMFYFSTPVTYKEHNIKNRNDMHMQITLGEYLAYDNSMEDFYGGDKHATISERT